MGDGLELAERRHVSAGIFVIPVALAFVAMAASVGGFVLWSTGNSDNRAVQRQSALIQHALEREFDLQVSSQEDAVMNEDAVRNTALAFDPDWVDANLGFAFYESAGYEQTAVLDADNLPIYLMHDGVSVDPGALDEDLDELAPLIARLRADMRAGALRAYMAGARSDAPNARDYVTMAGVPAMVTIVPIASPAERQEPGTEFLHVAVDYLEDDYASYLCDANLVEEARFRLTRSDEPDAAALPLLNASGRIVAFLEWKQDWPGRRLLMETLPAAIVALLLLGGLIALLVTRIWRFSNALERGRIQAEHLANHDKLTGLPNRAFFERRLAEASASPLRQGQLALFMLDLDRFKQVNDTLGHPAGDELIRSVGGRLRNVISAQGCVARLGGDEFAIIEPGLVVGTEALAMAGRIIEVLGQPFDLFGNEASVGVSVGIGLALDRSTTPAELVRRADIALYEAKASGRNCGKVYDSSMDVAVHQRHTVEAELREALRSGEQIDIVFEPITNATTGATIGAEALPRWQHPRLGSVAREFFIPVAESSGMIEQLGERLLRGACQLGARHPDRTISVNISLAQLRSPKFFSRVFDILTETGMRPGNLEIEITEGVLLSGPDVAADVLGKLRATGIRIALDDFGTGYSSLNFLKQYDVDHIKIDRAFAQDTGDDRSALAMVQAMVGLAHAMQIEVTAKGIDNVLQRNRFAGIGCDRLQGTSIGRALTAEETEAIFAGKRGVEAQSDAA